MLLLFTALAGCNITPLKNGTETGAFVQLKDVFTSSFLGVAPDGTAVLVDAGLDAKAVKENDALTELGLGPDDLAHIFLTHGHSDHLGGLASFPNATVWATEVEEALVKEEGGRVDAFVTDGQIVDAGGWAVEVYAVPGHTPGSAAYLIDGVLFTGDAAIRLADGTVATAPDKYDEDPEMAITSLCALAERLTPRATTITDVTYAHSGPSDVATFLADACL